jgi:hypothetical protein
VSTPPHHQGQPYQQPQVLQSGYPPPVPSFQPEPHPEPPRRGFLSSTRFKLITAIAAVVVVGAGVGLGLALTSSPGVPSTIHGTISSTELDGLGGPAGGSGQNCILNLPGQGSELTLKADGVTVGTAQLAPGGFHTHKFNGLGETCSENFTFINVPPGHQVYAVTVNVNNSGGFSYGGCTGTIYFRAARLATGKPIELSCS